MPVCIFRSLLPNAHVASLSWWTVTPCLNPTTRFLRMYSTSKDHTSGVALSDLKFPLYVQTCNQLLVFCETRIWIDVMRRLVSIVHFRWSNIQYRIRCRYRQTLNSRAGNRSKLTMISRPNISTRFPESARLPRETRFDFDSIHDAFYSHFCIWNLGLVFLSWPRFISHFSVYCRIWRMPVATRRNWRLRMYAWSMVGLLLIWKADNCRIPVSWVPVPECLVYNQRFSYLRKIFRIGPAASGSPFPTHSTRAKQCAGARDRRK